MANISSSSSPIPEPVSSPEPTVTTPDTNTDDQAEFGIRRLSNSTNASRQRDFYDTHRLNKRRSRPVSGQSQATIAEVQEHGKYPTYQRPSNFDQVEEQAHFYDAPEHHRPVDAAAAEENRPPTAATLASSADTAKRNSMRRRSSAGSRRYHLEEAPEVPAVPPVPSTDPSHTTEGMKDQPIEQDKAQPSAEDAQPQQPEPEKSEKAKDDEQAPRPSSNSPSPHPHPILNELYTISYLIFFAIWGTLARLGLQWLTFYPGAPIVTPVIWANFGGSAILGFLAEDQALFRNQSHIDSIRDKYDDEDDLKDAIRAESGPRKKATPLYIGLATGFCGSFTSFSSFMRDAFLATSNNLPTPFSHAYPATTSTITPSTTAARNGGYSLESLLGVILSTLALSLGGLIVGAHLAAFLEPTLPTLSPRVVRRVLDPSMLVLGIGVWLGALFMAIFPPDGADGRWRGEAIFAVLFAPLGCLARYYISLKLNPIVAAFPLGTFAVNMFGTAVEGMAYDVQHVGIGTGSVVGGGLVGCQVLQGVQDGFCGCLTTVSTWVAEVNGLRRRHGYVYAAVSVIGGWCLMIVIMGSVRWTVGFGQTACSTGYPNKVHG